MVSIYLEPSQEQTNWVQIRLKHYHFRCFVMVVTMYCTVEQVIHFAVLKGRSAKLMKPPVTPYQYANNLKGLTFHYVKDMIDVLDIALTKQKVKNAKEL